jgi:hypothetical protein
MLLQASIWLQQCRNSHEQCAVTASPAEMPTRVIDVSATANGLPSPFIYHPPPGSCGEYVALSYCWGDTPTVLLTEEWLLNSSTPSLDFQGLPPTFRDAILLTQSLGFQYLWIDALCIVQDSKKDWEEQSARMFSVFSIATLVIRAASGPNTQHSLFDTSGRAVPHRAELKVISDSTSSVARCFVREALRDSEPLDYRGWAYQEEFLASRIIHFGTREMEWECKEQHWSESGIHRMETYLPTWKKPLRRRVDPAEDGSIVSWELKRTPRTMWQRFVSQYCQRRLTLAKDKLPAMAGLVELYYEGFVKPWAGSDQYLAGLWRSQLPQTLLWYIGWQTGDFATSPEVARAPTWSWASIDYDSIQWLAHDSSPEAFASIEHAEISLVSENSYGEVLGGRIQIKAPVKRALLLPDTFYGDRDEVWAEGTLEEYRKRPKGAETRGACLGRVSFDLGTPQAISEDELLYVHCLRVTTLGSLAVELCDSGSSGQTWKRVGLISFFENSISWWQDCESSIVTLI